MLENQPRQGNILALIRDLRQAASQLGVELESSCDQRNSDARSIVLRDLNALQESLDMLGPEDARQHNADSVTVDCVQRLARQLPDIIVILDFHGIVRYVNPAYEHALNVSAATVTGQPYQELPLLTKDHVQALSGAIDQLRQGRKPDPFVIEVAGADGTTAHFEIYIDQLNPCQSERSVMIVARRISEQVRAIQALSESRRQLETLMGNLPGMAYRCLNDPDWTMEFVSRGAKALTGYEPQELIDNRTVTFAELIHPEDRPIVWEVVQTGIQHRRPFQMQYRIIRADGQERWVWEQGRAVFDEHGELKALEGFITDVSDRKHAEEGLRRSEDNYRQLVEDLNDAIFELDAKGKIVYISPVIEELTGYLVDELIGKSFTEFVHPDDIERLEDAMTAVLNGIRNPREYRLRSKKDGWLWFRSYSRRFVHEGKTAGIRGVLTNVTERKAAEAALHESRVLMSRTLSSSPVPTFIIDLDHKITQWNRACEILTGLPAKEMVGTRNQWKPFYPSERPVFADLIVDGKSDIAIASHYGGKFAPSPLIEGAYEAEDFFPDLDNGRGRWIFFTAAPITDSEGRMVGAAETLQDVTDRRQAVDRLRDRESELSSIFRAAPVGIGLVQDRVLRQVNRSLCEMLGYEQEELIDKSARLLYASEEEFERVGREKYAEIAVRGTGTMQTTWVRKDGAHISVLLSSTPLDVTDVSRGVTFTAVDITKRLKAESALRESEERYRRMIDTANEGIWTVDSELTTVYVNDKMSDLLGYTPEEMRGVSLSHFIAPNELEAHQIEMAARQDGERGNYVRRFLHRDGSIRWMLISASPMWEKDGSFAGSMAMVTDITESKKAEQALRDSEERYRRLFESANDAIFLMDGPRFVDCNPRTLAIFGCERPDIIGQPPFKFSPPRQPDGSDSMASALKYINAAFDGTPQSFEWSHCRLDGTLFDAEVSLTRLIVSDKPLLLAIVRDITDRKRSEEALRASEERFRTIFESALDLIFIKDKHRRYVACNPTMQETLGLSASEVIGSTDEQIFPAESAERFCHVDERVLRGEVYEGEQALSMGGENRRFHIVVVPIRDADGSVMGLCGIVRDITERMRIEEELARADKLESIGLLAGGIAHDFNNILAAILGNVSLAKMDLIAGTEIFDLLANAEKATERARDLTQQLLTFSKGGAPVKRTASIGEIISDCVSFSLRGSNVKCDLELEEDLPGAEVDAGQISQVIHNLIINADQAMPEGGRIEVSARAAAIDDFDQLPLQPGQYIQIRVKDEGHGIAESDLQKIFDPFFTTKEHGNGLGLATSFSIVKKHEGHITCESRLGEGTAFTVYLPASDQPVPKPPAARGDGGPHGGRILVVDDELGVRDVLTRVLEKGGYSVTAVSDGGEAVSAYMEGMGTTAAFNLVIMDLTIPGGMGGKEAMRQLLIADPSVRVIVASGYSNDPVMADYRRYGFAGRVTKPFDSKQLIAVVEEVLATVEAEPGGQTP